VVVSGPADPAGRAFIQVAEALKARLG
jgi:hypothetical protein